MRVLLCHIDGKIPNIALMRLAAHHRDRGDSVELRHTPTVAAVERQLWDEFDTVYGSLIFEKSRPVAERLRKVWPKAIIGGTGWNDKTLTLESIGVTTTRQDYSDYPSWRQSIGFTQRGCRLACSFCLVRITEGRVREEQTIFDLWRGDPWPKQLILLDNDFFGSTLWRQKIEDIKRGGFKVCFCQGINARLGEQVRHLDDEAAAAIASVPYYDDQFSRRCIYTAWDNRPDEERLFLGLSNLVKHGVKPDHIMVYMLIGFWPGETDEDWEYRRRRLREFGCRPYPMPYVRNDLTRGFQRFCVGAYDKRFSWDDFKAAGCRPEKLGATAA